MKRVVLVNGGSRGIGAATVRKFASLGDTVVFTYAHSEEAARALASETGAVALSADSGKRSAILSAVETVIARFGRIDVLVNNAGIGNYGLITDVSEEEWERLLSVNLSAPFYYSQAVSSHMVRQKSGVIVNVSSMWGVVGASCEVAYSATKAGVIGLTKGLAKELGPSGVRVNAIAPGMIATEMNSHFSEETVAAIAEETPLCRIGTAEEVAALVAFLASEDAAFITGQVILQDGGFANC